MPTLFKAGGQTQAWVTVGPKSRLPSRALPSHLLSLRAGGGVGHGNSSRSGLRHLDLRPLSNLNIKKNNSEKVPVEQLLRRFLTGQLWHHFQSLSAGACWTADSKATQRTTQRQQKQRPQNCTEGWNWPVKLQYEISIRTLIFVFVTALCFCAILPQFTLWVKSFLDTLLNHKNCFLEFMANIQTFENIRKKCSSVNSDLPLTSYFNQNDPDLCHSREKKEASNRTCLSNNLWRDCLHAYNILNVILTGLAF